MCQTTNVIAKPNPKRIIGLTCADENSGSMNRMIETRTSTSTNVSNWA